LQIVLLKMADLVLFWAHAVIAVWCVFGWLVPGAEKLHLFVIVGIAISWYGLGMRYGIGYCILTDWQWRVKERLGRTTKHDSFVHLLLERASGLHINEKQVKRFAYAAYWVSAVISIYINFVGR